MNVRPLSGRTETKSANWLQSTQSERLEIYRAVLQDRVNSISLSRTACALQKRKSRLNGGAQLAGVATVIRSRLAST